jgi:hypothetical protein
MIQVTLSLLSYLCLACSCLAMIGIGMMMNDWINNL